MKLVITTPTEIVVDTEAVAVRAEDGSGSFGILGGHADLVTALVDGVVSWKDGEGTRRYCAVRRGVLTVTDGRTVAVATREAVPGTDLDHLEAEVVAAFEERADAERAARTDVLKLEVKAIRQIVANLSARPGGMMGGEP